MTILFLNVLLSFFILIYKFTTVVLSNTIKNKIIKQLETVKKHPLNPRNI